MTAINNIPKTSDTISHIFAYTYMISHKAF